MIGRLLAVALLALSGTTTAQAQTVRYIHTDALGTPVAVTNASRTVIEISEYEPYGQVINRPVNAGPGYTGHVMDVSTGLAYMQQRYYDPTLGRFLSVDPVTANPNSGGNFSRYWYANNNPYRFTDPDGRQAFPGNSIIPRIETAKAQAQVASAALRSGDSAGALKAASGSQRSPAPATDPRLSDGKGVDVSSVVIGDTTITSTAVVAAGMGIKAEKVSGPGGDKLSLVTPALGASAQAHANALTVSYNFSDQLPAAVDVGIGGGVRGGLLVSGGVSLTYRPPGTFEMQATVGPGIGASLDLFGVGYRLAEE